MYVIERKRVRRPGVSTRNEHQQKKQTKGASGDEQGAARIQDHSALDDLYDDGGLCSLY
jgi:hypothetical protein